MQFFYSMILIASMAGCIMHGAESEESRVRNERIDANIIKIRQTLKKWFEQAQKEQQASDQMPLVVQDSEQAGEDRKGRLSAGSVITHQSPRLLVSPRDSQ